MSTLDDDFPDTDPVRLASRALFGSWPESVPLDEPWRWQEALAAMPTEVRDDVLAALVAAAMPGALARLSGVAVVVP